MNVKPERTGWRDAWLSGRHRLWGWDCPWQDIDWLEYDNGHPVALFEYKHSSAPPLNPSHLGVQAMIELADRARLPFFGVRYCRPPVPVRFSITGLNEAGRRLARAGWRQRHELLLIATKGEPPVPQPADRPDSVVNAPRAEHSEKPDVFYDVIERMYPAFSKIEMFARHPREGWGRWGNQAT